MNVEDLHTFSTLKERTVFDWLTRSDTECPILETVNTYSVPPPLSILVLEVRHVERGTRPTI